MRTHGCRAFDDAPLGVSRPIALAGIRLRVANSLNLEATNVIRSASRSTERYPHGSRGDFRLVGTQSIDVVDHIAVAGQRREVVQALGAGQRYGWAARAFCSTQAEGSGTDGGG